MERGQFTFYRSYYEAIKQLKKADQAAVLMAICAYALDEEMPGLTGTPAAIFALVKPTLDTSRRKAASGKAGGESKQTASKTEAKPKQTAREKEKEKEKEKEGEIEKEKEYECTPQTPQRFTPPSVSDVREYCLERGNNVDPQTFVDFYAGKNWMVGKTKMVDWKACVRTWESRERKAQNAKDTVTFMQMREEARA